MPGTKLGFKFGGTSIETSTDLGETFVRRDYFERKPLYLAEALVDGTSQTPQAFWLFGAEAAGVGQTGVYSTSTPVLINSDDWIQISTSGEVSAGIKRDGTLWTWGSGANGVLGLGDTSARSVPTQVGTDTNWTKIEVAKQAQPSFSNTGTYFNGYVNVPYGTTDLSNPFMLGLKNNGTLWGWGGNTYGQNGTGAERTSPTQIGSETNWADMSAGPYHAIARKGDGTIWTWGWNGAGQLGLGDTTNRSSPTQVGTDKDWAYVYANWGTTTHPNITTRSSTSAVKTNGKLYIWGTEGGLTKLATIQNTPLLHDSPDNSNWKSVFLDGNGMTFGIKTDGTLWAEEYDFNPYGLIPLRKISDKNNWRSISYYGESLTVSIDYEGGAYAHSTNSYAAGKPVIVTALYTAKKWFQLQGGRYHTLGIELII